MAQGMFSYAMKPAQKDPKPTKAASSKISQVAKGTLFGKPRGEVIKHPGAFSAKAKAAGKSTAAYAKQEEHASGLVGKQARLAETFAKLRAKK